MEVLRCPGAATDPQSNLTITLQDGAAAIPSCNTGDTNFGIWTTGGTFAPSAYLDNVQGVVNYAAAGAPALQSGHSAANQGSATLNGVFAGDTTNGNWSLYLVDDGADAASVSFSSWDILITFSNASSPSTTTLTPNPTTAFTSANVSLTAQVTTGATGTVTFKEGNTTLTCSEGAEPRPLNGSAQAICTTTFSAEGFHSLSASYSGNGTFVASSGSAGVYTQNHATNTGTVYCNTGAINGDGRADLGFTHTNTYPSVIFVGDGMNTDLPNQVNTVSVQLKNFSVIGGTTDMHMLLVAPDGTHALDFWGDAGAGGTSGSGDYTLIDGSPILPNNTAISPGTYGPTSYFATDAFTPAPPSPAPQLPSSFSLATPAGPSTFQTAFVGANAHGAWKLFLFNDSGSGDTTTLAGGWCLNIQPATGHPTTVTVTSNPFPKATKGASVTFTATIGSNPAVGNTGKVTFTEHGAALVGAPNGGVSDLSNGVATTSTSQLPEGDHTITAAYHDASNTFNDMVGTVTMRVDANTMTPLLNANTWTYCNQSGIVIPRGVNFVDDIGAAAPNPSNVFVTNLPGTINAVSLTLKSFHVTSPGDLDSLVVGPNGISAPTTAQTLDFFTGAGGSGGSTAFTHDTTFHDGSAVSCATSGPAPGATAGPTSCVAVTPSYFASPFYTLPGAFQRATTGGNFTFDTGTYTPNAGGGVYTNTLPNGTWSLYFNQNIHHSGDGASAWCANFTENPVTVMATKGHTGRPPNGNFQQGHAGASFSFNITNSGPGPTGDPDGMHGLKVVDVLDASAFTAGTLPIGSPWNCTAVTNTVTCTSSLAIAQTMSYPVLTIPVNVLKNAPASATNQGSLSGGGITATTSTMDTVTIDPAPLLAVTKAHTGTFTQGSTATWTLQVSNTSATAAGNTDGTTVTVTDTLPTGYTGWTGSGTGWMCNTNTNVISCTSNDVVAGNGGMFGLITLTGTVPAASPVSVSNFAQAFGGGDVVHVTIDSAAMSNTDMVTVVQVPASIMINGSSTQSATVNTAFGSLAVTVKDAGMVTIPNYMSVVFTAPASGPSGTFDNTTNTKSVTTGTGGSAGIADPGTFTANGTAGTYSVDVAAGPAPHATFNLTNTAPDLTISKTHSGNFTQGVSGTYSITVTNSSATGPVVAGHLVTVTDALPTGLTPTAATGTGWTCVVSAPNVSCTRSDALAVNTSYPAITLTVNVAPDAPATVTNTATVSGGGEVNTSNDSASDPTTVNPGADLTIMKGHTGNFFQGQVGAIYNVTVTNSGTGVTSGTVTVTDALPSGLTPTAASGTGWTCNLASQTVSCTRSDALAAGQPYPGIQITVTVANNAPSSVINTATVSGGGETNTANDSSSDSTTIGAGADLTITKTHTGNFTQGDTGKTYTITVTNSGSATTAGTVTVTDVVPPGLTPTAASGTGWTCGISTQTVTCSRSDGLASAGSYPAITLTVNVAANASSTIINTATVAGGGDVNTGNNSASDQTTVNPGADLTIMKSHTGNFFQGQVGAVYNVTVTNSGTGPTNGTVTVTDQLPPGLTPTAASGTGWTCNLASQTVSCTRSDALAGGQPYPGIQITVTVANNASSSVINTATVSGGGETNTANDSSSDSTTISAGADLTITKTHTGNFTQGDTGKTYTITVTNSGSATTAGTVTVTDVVPPGLTPTAASGTGWTCGISTQTVTCSRSDGLASAGSYPAITLTVNVAANASSTIINTATVAGGGDVNTGNNSASDQTTVGVGSVQVTVSTNISGPTVSVDGGTAFTGSQVFSWTIGSSHSLSTSSPQTTGGTQYVWLNWSDSGAITHNVTASSGTTAYTATFKTQFQLTTAVSSAAGGSISPATGFFDSGSMVPVSATANAGYVFTGFSGALSGTTTPQNITMSAPATVTANFGPGPTGLGGSFGAKTGPIGGQRVWTVNIGNGGPGVALGTTVTSFTVLQTSGTACNPTVLTPMPVSAGDIAPGATAPAHVTIDFTGCFPNAFFKVTATVSANGGAATGTIQRLNQLQ